MTSWTVTRSSKVRRIAGWDIVILRSGFIGSWPMSGRVLSIETARQGCMTVMRRLGVE